MVVVLTPKVDDKRLQTCDDHPNVVLETLLPQHTNALREESDAGNQGSKPGIGRTRLESRRKGRQSIADIVFLKDR
jgi:hypothetical protein